MLADSYDGFVIDLDGVVHLGWEPLPGAVEALRRLASLGKGVVFLTNEPRFTRAAVADRLRAFGVDLAGDAVITSAWAGALAASDGGASVYVIGSDDLRAEVVAAGGKVVGPEAADRVLVAGHTGFSYDELRSAMRACGRGAELVATNRDATFPMPDGPWPATGAILAAVETATGRTAVSVGKPDPAIFRVAAESLGVARIAVIGDRVDTDIVGGRAAGLATILVGGRDPLADHCVPDLASVVA